MIKCGQPGVADPDLYHRPLNAWLTRNIQGIQFDRVQTADRQPKIARLESQVSIAVGRIQLAGSGKVYEVVGASVAKFIAARLSCLWRFSRLQELAGLTSDYPESVSLTLAETHSFSFV
jgi:hypothetical protein